MNTIFQKSIFQVYSLQMATLRPSLSWPAPVSGPLCPGVHHPGGAQLPRPGGYQGLVSRHSSSKVCQLNNIHVCTLYIVHTSTDRRAALETNLGQFRPWKVQKFQVFTPLFKYILMLAFQFLITQVFLYVIQPPKHGPPNNLSSRFIENPLWQSVFFNFCQIGA